MSQLIQLAAAKMLQEAVEQEVSEQLGRGHYERRDEDQQGLRHGCEPGRKRSATRGRSSSRCCRHVD